MASWVFRAGRPFLPAETPQNWAPGGTEQAILHLTAALAALGESVTLLGAAATPRSLNGVTCLPAPAEAHIAATIQVAINDARLLFQGTGLPVVWFHNEVTLARELRRGRLPALLRARPLGIFVGATQMAAASRWLPLRARHVIPLGLTEAALTAPAAHAPPPPRALFTSQAYRGLAEVLALWNQDVAPAVPGARLDAYIAAADLPAFTAQAGPAATIHPRQPHAAVLAELGRSRVWLAPGHASETFCLAAAEALALGVPVITLGTGALRERVRHGVDGFICQDFAEMAARARDVLTDDALWTRLHNAALQTRAGAGWADVARLWITTCLQ